MDASMPAFRQGGAGSFLRNEAGPTRVSEIMQIKTIMLDL
jgi:hypothetical protein